MHCTGSPEKGTLLIEFLIRLFLRFQLMGGAIFPDTLHLTILHFSLLVVYNVLLHTVCNSVPMSNGNSPFLTLFEIQ